MMVVLLAVYPGDGMADWELRLTASVQHHKRASYNISLAWEKIKIQNLMYGFYWTCLAFLKHIYQSHLIFNLFFLEFWKKNFFWLCWVFIALHGLSLVAASRGYSLVEMCGLLFAVASLVAEQRLETMRASVVVAHGLSFPTACGIFLGQGSYSCPLCGQVDS